MNLKLKAVAAMVLAASIAGTLTMASDATPKKKAKKAAPAATCDSCAQIDALRHDLQGQIDALKSDLAAKDAALRDAQQKAADAQASADRANAASAGLADNAAAVSSLQGTVNDLKANQLSLATTVSDETSKIKAAIENPDTIHYKGVTISPAGSFIEAATVWRSAATGGDIPTAFTAIPLQNSDAANISEFTGTGRQSRLALTATGKISNATLKAYYEMDWLGVGTSSNYNQSNSFVMRQRQLWLQAALSSGWTFTTGQMWSLATETTKGLQNGTEILPGTIDPNYSAGFVWERQYGFRVSKDIGKKFFAGLSIENAQTLGPAGSNMGGNYVIGAPGQNSGANNTGANYTLNVAPDIIAKIAFEPGWGHWELFNINRFFRDRVYPTGGSPFNDYAYGGGIGGGFRGPLGKYASVGLKGLWGKGMGRYGDSTIADVTIAPWGGIVPLSAFSALGTLELTPNKRTSIYLNYGTDYVFRHAVGSWGYGSLATDMSGCNAAEPAGAPNAPASPAHCGNQNKDIQEATIGYWYNIYNGPKGRFRQGFQYSYFARNLWSGTGGPTNPSNSALGTDNVIETSFRYYLP